MKKPELRSAKTIRRTSLKGLLDAGISEEIARFVMEREGKEHNTGDIGINSHFKILGDCDSTPYISVKTEGSCDHISMFRLCGGCNHLEVFELSEFIEKSEDYDSLSDSEICWFSDDYETAKIELLNNYIGKTLRVVARTGEESAPFGKRYYLFSVDKYK